MTARSEHEPGERRVQLGIAFQDRHAAVIAQLEAGDDVDDEKSAAAGTPPAPTSCVAVVGRRHRGGDEVPGAQPGQHAMMPGPSSFARRRRRSLAPCSGLRIFSTEPDRSMGAALLTIVVVVNGPQAAFSLACPLGLALHTTSYNLSGRQNVAFLGLGRARFGGTVRTAGSSQVTSPETVSRMVALDSGVVGVPACSCATRNIHASFPLKTPLLSSVA